MKLGERYLKMRKIHLRHYPELLRFETFDQRFIALREAGSNSSTASQALMGLAIVFSWPCFGVVMIRLVGPQSMPYVIPAGFVLVGCAAHWFNLKQRARVRRRLRELLNERGIKTCVACGYDMRGLENVTCPECGGGGRKKHGNE